LIPPLEPIALYWTSIPSPEPTAGIQAPTRGLTNVLPAPEIVPALFLALAVPAVTAITIAMIAATEKTAAVRFESPNFRIASFPP
jgi:hypothetical protein